MTVSSSETRRRWFLRRHGGKALVIAVAILVEMAFASAVPYSFKYLVDTALLKHDAAALARVLVLLGLGPR